MSGDDIQTVSSPLPTRQRAVSCLEFSAVSHLGNYSPPVCPWSRSSWSFDEGASTTTGGSRSMSIFDTLDEIRGSSAPTPKLLAPQVGQPDSPGQVSTAGSLGNSSILHSPVSGGNNDKANAEASTLIKECGRRGDLTSCWSIWNNLLGSVAGLVPNEITLGCMVDALVSNQEVLHAEALVNQWKYQISPNTVVYSTLIHGWAKQNDAKRALAIFNQMKDEGVPCNAVTYNCMIHACVRVGDTQGALDLLYSMKGLVKADKFTYSTIIKGYCGRGEIENALSLFESMLAEGLTPDLVIYNTLLDGCVKTRFHDVCDKLLDDMVTEWRISPNSYTLSILIKRFGRQGDLLRAFELVDEFPRKYGFRANAHVWTCLISACVSHGRLVTAECVFAAMCRRGANSTLMNGNYELETAREYDIVNNALSLAGMCPPDAKTYETLALGFARYGDYERAGIVARDGYMRYKNKLSPQCTSLIV